MEFILEQVKLKKIPNYCAYMGVKFANKFPKGDQLRKKYGPGWNHMHHYCWALVDLQNGHPDQAIGNLDYVLSKSSRTFRLRPMVLLKKALILTANQQYSEAISVYGELIKIKPESENGWIGLANLLLILGDKNGAMKVAKQGLKRIPNSEKLKSFIR